MNPAKKRDLLAKIKQLAVYPAIKDVLIEIVESIGEPLPPDAIAVESADSLMMPNMFKDKEDNA